MKTFSIGCVVFSAMMLFNIVVGKKAKLGKDNDEKTRTGKLFSLFNIVQFENSPCRSNIITSGAASTNRNGTCFTSSQCISKSGTISGNCAAGFGVCCVFLLSGTSNTVTQNCTYIQNPGYPASYSGTADVSYTIRKCGNVCYLRLDFESFNILGTLGSAETSGGICSMDTFTVVNAPALVIPTICGDNTGQHMYIDMGALPGDTATLDFTFSGASSTRQWDIKVTQVECNAGSNKPPNGCLQYLTGLTGRISTFNFNPTSGQTNLANQKYAICIRPEEGYCCIQYSLCSDPNSFSLDTSLNNAGVDVMCTKDYIGIAAAFSVLDCTQPFTVEIITDNLPDSGIATTLNTSPSRGVCLMYMQVACSN